MLTSLLILQPSFLHQTFEISVMRYLCSSQAPVMIFSLLSIYDAVGRIHVSCKVTIVYRKCHLYHMETKGDDFFAQNTSGFPIKLYGGCR